MMYPFMTLEDDSEIVHSHVFDEDGVKKVFVHFERPTEEVYDSARCELPSYKWISREGFTDEEIGMFEKIVQSNAHLFYEYAELGGIDIA